MKLGAGWKRVGLRWQAQGDAGEASGEDDFVLPADIDPYEVAGAIADKLRGSERKRPDKAQPLLKTRMDGRIVVLAAYVQQLGGRRVLDQIVSELRARRVLRAIREHAQM